jgi:hypothetical protein
MLQYAVAVRGNYNTYQIVGWRFPWEKHALSGQIKEPCGKGIYFSAKQMSTNLRAGSDVNRVV